MAISSTPEAALSTRPVTRESEHIFVYPQAVGGPLGGPRQHASGGPAPSPLSLALLLRYRWLILSVFLLVAVPSVAAIWKTLDPLYRATAQVRVAPKIPRLVFKTEDNGMIPLYNNFLNTQESVILSPQVLERVLDQAAVRDTTWYRENSTNGLLALRENLLVSVQSKTELIDVHMATRDPREAATIANAVVDQYLSFVQERSRLSGDLVYQRLLEQFNSLRDQIEGRKGVAAQLRKELGTGTPEQLVVEKRIRLDQAEAQLADLQQKIALATWQLQELQALDSNRTAGGATSQPAASGVRYDEDAEWRRLYMDLRTAQHHLEVEQDRFGEQHPRIAELKKSIALASELLQSRQQQIEDSFRIFGRQPSAMRDEADGAMGLDVHELEWRVKTLQKEEQFAQKTLEHKREDFERTFERAQLLQREADELEHQEEIYGAVRATKDEKEMESNVPGSISLQAHAIAPIEPFRDRRPLLSAVACIVGLIFAVGLAFIRMHLTQSFEAPDDLSSVTPAPFLGHLPILRNVEMPTSEELRAQSESIRMVRTALLQRLNGGGASVMVTSAGPSAGKSTVAVLLARSLGQGGKKVLLVDADLRRPAVSKRLGMEDRAGLAELLAGEASDSHVIIPERALGVDVLPSGASNPAQGGNPEVLANGAMTQCLQRWKRSYDVVVLDSSPVLPVADARILSCLVDGNIMVVRERHCRRPEVYDALACLGSSGGRLLGTVFLGNGRGGRYAPYYHDYYGPRSSESSLDVRDKVEPRA